MIVKLGDRVIEGNLILTIETSKVEKPAAAPQFVRVLLRPRLSQAPSRLCHRTQGMGYRMRGDGAGRRPGGYSAAFRSADLGMKTVLVERYPPWAACA